MPAASAPLLASATTTGPSSSLPSLTKAQVHYWRELCGILAQAGTAGVASAEDFPPALRPSRSTFKAMVERGILARRQRAWHLTRHWYARLTQFRVQAVDTPQLRVSERPAPGVPSYAELKAWEAICRWLETLQRQRARLPFAGLAAFVAEDADAQLALGDMPQLPAGLLRGMRKARIVRHTSTCEWVLSRAWRERILALWQGHEQFKRELPAVTEAAQAEARSLVADIDTWILNWRVEEALPTRLCIALDTYQEQAREQETEVETYWRYDGVPLHMYRWGTKAESGGGVSWSYVLLNPSLRLVIRKAPLGGIIAQARLGSECLWRRTPRAALDELDALMRRLWGTVTGHWQVSQVHLAHDVANAPLLEAWATRFVSRSRSQAAYEASRADVEQLAQELNGSDDEDEDLPFCIDWEAQFATARDSLGWDPFAPRGEDGEDDPFEEAVEDRAVTLHSWGRRLSGLTWSPGGAVSVVLYRKDWEQRRRGKAFMTPLWQGAGWLNNEPVTRCEVRLRREALRVLHLPQLPERRLLDDPWQLLEQLPAVFATVVGQADEPCPDAVNVAWVRLVVPCDEDTNRARWETDPVWHVIQAAPFAPTPAAARRLIRRTQHTRCAEQLDAILYGVLKRRVAELHPKGEEWDISRALAEAAAALTEIAAQPGKDFGAQVRTCRQELGLPVAPTCTVLPLRALQLSVDPPDVLAALDAEPPEAEQERAIWRRCAAERRMREAYVLLEEAEQQGMPVGELESLAAIFEHETAVYEAALTDCTVST
jgi:hypothetical protein